MAQDHTKSIIYYVSYIYKTSLLIAWDLQSMNTNGLTLSSYNLITCKILMCLLHNLITFHQLLDLDVFSL